MTIMKILTLNPLALLVVIIYCSLAYAEESNVFSSPKEKVNYAIGVEIARNYKSRGIDIDLDMVNKGLKDGASGGGLLISEKELRNILISVQSDLRRKQSVLKRSSGNGLQGKGDDPLPEIKEKLESKSQ